VTLKNPVRHCFTGFFYVHGWAVFRKEPGKAVRLCAGCAVLLIKFVILECFCRGSSCCTVYGFPTEAFGNDDN